MYSYGWMLFILCSLCSVSEKMRVAVSFLLFFTLIFNQASGDCYNECMKGMTVSLLLTCLISDHSI